MDKPGAFCWNIGKLAIVTLCLTLFGAIIFWMVSERKGILYEIRELSQEAKYSIVITYLYLISSYFLTILSSAYVFQSPKILEVMTLHPKYVVTVSLIVMTVLTALLEYIPYTKKETLLKTGLWTLHSIVMGPAFAYFGTFICVESVIKTSFALLLATAIAFTAPRDLYNDIKLYVQSVYSVVTITSFFCFLFNPPVNTISLLLLTGNLCGGIMLYFGVFVINTQYMLSQVTQSEFDPVYTAAVMYLSTLNLYLRVAMFHVVELTDITNKEE